jgi:leucine dehydrogenase
MSVATRHDANGRPAGPRAARVAAEPGVKAEATTAVPPVHFDHEDLVVRRGRRSGRYVIVAIHSTALGPALGGVRLWHYAATIDGARDGLRLAAGMTYKAAAAGLELGGGKGVVCAPAGAPPRGRERRDMLLDFADLVESLEGRYITAEDVGISADDLVVIRERTEHVTGLPPERGGSGDPSPFTALGVEAAMRACARERFGSADLSGRRVAVVGIGHVGEKLARRLAAAGTELLISDIDERKRPIAAELGAQWLDPGEALLAECDLLAPCALGGAIDAGNASRLSCAVVCGSANNQLAEDGLDEVLAAREVLYAPDFIVNAGGLIHVYKEIRGYSEDEARELVLGIETNVARVLTAARERSITPLRAACELARERLARASEGSTVLTSPAPKPSPRAAAA